MSVPRDEDSPPGQRATARSRAARSRHHRLSHQLRLPAFPSLPPGWPLTALFLLYPLWWVLGLRVFIFPLLALPMGFALLRRRPIVAPPGFGLWILFLVWLVVSISMLPYHPPGTYGSGFDLSRLLSVAFRLAQYLAVTIILLYVGNLTERELPRARVVRLLAFFFLVTVAGGLLGLLWPRLDFSSPTEILLPQWIASDPWVQTMVHPSAAQIHNILGYPSPRPAAPFGFTNTWGEMLNLLLPWFVVATFAWGRARTQAAAVVVLVTACVPAVYSLNRGLWIGIGLALLYFCLRLALRGRLWALGTLGFAFAVGSLVFAASPLHDIVQSRLNHPHSNDVRLFTTVKAIRATTHSPVLGYGSTRDIRGTASSIAIDKSPTCPKCGTPPLGSNGQLWLVLVSQGYVGAALYVGFFVRVVLRYRRDPSPIGMAGLLVLLLSLFYMLVYNAVVIPLSVQMLSLALLWRNETFTRGEGAAVASRLAAGRSPSPRRQ